MTSPVINRAKWLIFLPCIIFHGCASSALLQETDRNCRCFLPCDGSPELEKHDSVRVLVQHLSDDLELIRNVSSLYDGGRCSVPGCFQRSMHYRLQIYANDKDPVPKILLNKTGLQPECDPEAISDKKTNSADGKLCNELLIPLAFCFWIVFLLEGPR